MNYKVTTVSMAGDSRLVFGEVGTYEDKTKAMNEAKRAASTRENCIIYGPSSIAYIGQDITAVVSWQ